MKLEKICKIHGELAEKDIYVEVSKQYKNGRYIRCRLCKNTNTWKRSDPICAKHGRLTDELLTKRGTCRICHRLGANKKRNTDPVAKAARNAKSKEWRDKNHATFREKEKLWRSRWPEGYRNREVVKLRNLTAEQYEEMIKVHDNKCAICGEEETRKACKSDKPTRLCIDHCHETGKVRGLLCHACNTAIGKFKDDPQLIICAIFYLELHAS